jgi:exodeoxyribonuclease V alpha subunit
LDAVLERITDANLETGYTVARVATGRSSDLLTVVGALFGAQPGERLRLRGRWASHPQYGRQFQVEAYDTVLPATMQGIRRYLGSGLIKGIGPKMAERIVEHFGQATLEVIEQAPGRLVEVPGLGPKRTAMITAAWAEQRAIKEVMVFLQGVGVSTSLGVRVYKTYRDQAIEVVRREPYRLAGEVWGIGFKTADQLAQRLGIPHDSPERVKAGLQFALSEASGDGHCYLPEAELVAKATGLLGVDGGLAGRCLEELVAEEGVVAEPLPAAVAPDAAAGTGRAIWLVPFHRAEVSLAVGLLGLLQAPVDRLARFQAVDWTVALAWLRQRTGVTLAPEQEAAVRLALTQRVAVLTGGPGCGKSYSVRAVVALARAKGAKVVLAAPTAGPPTACRSWPGWRRPPCTGCCSCAPAGMPPLTATIPWTPTWWWWMRSPCWTCCWPTSSSRRSHRGRSCWWSATWISCPASGPGRSCAICWPPSACPGCG